MIQDEKIIGIFEEIIKINKKFITDGHSLSPMCAIIEEGYKTGLIVMPFKNIKQKNAVRELIKKLVVSKKTIAYIIGMDTKMTQYEKGNIKNAIVKDALVHSIYTPKDAFARISPYSKVRNKIIFEEERDNFDEYDSIWNVWNTHDESENEDVYKAYQRFKEDNPEKFEGVI